jgi:hypothetical protein
MPLRSTTSLRQLNQIPYRIDLAGGWLDQPFVSTHHHGPVITLCLEPDHEFDGAVAWRQARGKLRQSSGMSYSCSQF